MPSRCRLMLIEDAIQGTGIFRRVERGAGLVSLDGETFSSYLLDAPGLSSLNFPRASAFNGQFWLLGTDTHFIRKSSEILGPWGVSSSSLSGLLSLPTKWLLYDAGLNLFLTVSDQKTAVSADGESWSGTGALAHSDFTGSGSYGFRTVANSGNGLFCATYGGASTSGQGDILWSSDGVAWNRVIIRANGFERGVVCLNGVFFVQFTVTTVPQTSYIYSSADAQNWTLVGTHVHSGQNSGGPNLITVDDTRILCQPNYNGEFYSTTDGQSLTKLTDDSNPFKDRALGWTENQGLRYCPLSGYIVRTSNAVGRTKDFVTWELLSTEPAGGSWNYWPVTSWVG